MGPILSLDTFDRTTLIGFSHVHALLQEDQIKVHTLHNGFMAAHGIRIGFPQIFFRAQLFFFYYEALPMTKWNLEASFIPEETGFTGVENARKT